MELDRFGESPGILANPAPRFQGRNRALTAAYKHIACTRLTTSIFLIIQDGRNAPFPDG